MCSPYHFYIGVISLHYYLFFVSSQNNANINISSNSSIVFTKEVTTGQQFDIVIIGSGVAGLTAAIYCGRLGRTPPLVLTGADGVSGGELILSFEVENYPGFPFSISGENLTSKMVKQAVRSGARMVAQTVRTVDLSRHPFRIESSQAISFFTNALIIATGAQAKWLGAEGEFMLRGNYIHTCALCDGQLYPNQKVVVVGGGNSAMMTAIYMARIAQTVTIIHRRKNFRASVSLIRRIKKQHNIKFLAPYIVKRWIMGTTGELVSAFLKRVGTSGRKLINCSGAFINIGSIPQTNFLNGQVDVDSNGYILHYNHTMTSIPGVFAAGQVSDPRYKQAITAAGMGAQAAIDADIWLQKKMFRHSIDNSRKEQKYIDTGKTVDIGISTVMNNNVDNQMLITKDINKNPFKQHMDFAQLSQCNLTEQKCIKEIIRTNPVVIFSKTYCPYCKRAKNIMRLENVIPYVIELDLRPDGKLIQNTLMTMTGRRTVPNIFVGAKNIGGGDETVQLHDVGKLKQLLLTAKAY